MKKVLLIACTSLLAFAAMAQGGKKPSVVKSEKTQVTAVVENIDHATREITLRGPEETVTMKVGDEVRNFDQIKKGDKVQTTFYQSVAFSLAKKGEAPPPQADQAVFVAEKGQKPAGMAVATKQVSATVEKVDAADREVTLKGPQGNTFVVNVDERAGDLSRIKKGDEVVATYTEALAISVMKPGQ